MCRTSNQEASIRVYRDLASLEELQDFWNSRQTAPTGRLDFYQSITCASAEFVRPHVIVSFKDGQPRCLLLGRLEKRRIDARLGYLRLPMPCANILTFDDCGWLSDVPATESQSFIDDILASLNSGEADAAMLQHLDIAYPICKLATSLSGRFTVDRSPMLLIARIRRLNGSQDFLDSLPGKQRYNQRRRARILSDSFEGRIAIRCFRDSGEITQLLKDTEEIAETSYQRGLGVGFVNDDQMHNRLTLLAAKGILRAHILYIQCKPCAFWITSLYQGTLYSDFLGFSPAYASFGPGSYLVIKAIEDICNEDNPQSVNSIDFGPGDAEWKSLLSNDQQQLASFYIFAPTIRGVTLNLVRASALAVDRAGRAILRRTGALTRIKRQWRQLAIRKTRPAPR